MILSHLVKGYSDLGEITPEFNHDQLRLGNSVVSDLQNVFIHPDIDLGTDRDALLCILPALRLQLDESHGPSLVPSLEKAAAQARQDSLWTKAEKLMQYACETCETHMKDTNDSDALHSALTATGEFYRWFFTQPPRREKRVVGYRGTIWFVAKLTSTSIVNSRHRAKLHAILPRYIALGVQSAREYHEQKFLSFLKLQSGVDSPWNNDLQELSKPSDAAEMRAFVASTTHESLSNDQSEFLYSIHEKKRARCLYYLCRLTPGTLSNPGLHSTLPLAASNGWDEVADALIQLEVPIDGKDGLGKTALIHYASFGRHNRVQALIRCGAGSFHEDNEMNSALLYAAKNGYENVLRCLLETGDAGVNGNATALFTPLAAASSNGHEAIIELLLKQQYIDGQLSGQNRLTPLLAAIERGFIGIVEKFLGVKETWQLEHINIGLRLSAHWNQLEIFKTLLKTPGADPFQKGECPGASAYDSYSTLDIAAMNGYQEIAGFILGIDRTGANYDRRVLPLCLAVIEKRPDVVHALITADACDVNELDEQGKTAFTYAALMQQPDIVKILIAADACDINRPDAEGKTALIHAVIRGYADIVSLLTASDKCDVDALDKEGNSALMHATLQDREEIVSILVNSENCNLNTTDTSNRTALIHATLLDRGEVVSTLANSDGCNADSIDDEGKTALIYATLQGNQDIVARLIAAHACNVNKSDQQGKTALIHSIEQARIDIAAMLLDTQNCDVNMSDDQGKTALIYSTEQGREDLVSLLLTSTQPCDVNKRDEQGKTALFYSAEQGREDIVSLLVNTAIPCHVNMHYENGKTTIMRSIEKGRGDIVSLLIASKGPCNVDEFDEDGNTALIYATCHGHTDIVSMLFNISNASPQIAGKNGCTPLFYAIELGFQEIAMAIIESLHHHNWPPTSSSAGYDWISRELLHSLQKKEPEVAERLAHAVAALFKQGKINPDITDAKGKTALEHAINLGYETVATVLRDGLPQPKEYCAEAFDDLKYALFQGSIPVALQLIKEGECDLTISLKHDFKRYTVFTFSAARNYTDVVREILLTDDCDINQIDENGETALSRAVTNGHEQVVDLLLNDERINIHTIGEGQPPRHLATVVYYSQKDSSAVLRSILNHPQSDSYATPLDKRAFLMDTAKSRHHPNCLRVLLEEFPSFLKARNTLSGDSYGLPIRPFLVEAAYVSPIECVSVILEAENHKIDFVIQALSWALMLQRLDVAQSFTSYLFARSSAEERHAFLRKEDLAVLGSLERQALDSSESRVSTFLENVLCHIIVFGGPGYLDNISVDDDDTDDPDYLNAVDSALKALPKIDEKQWEFFLKMVGFANDWRIDPIL